MSPPYDYVYFATREEAVNYVDEYYRKGDTHWFRCEDRRDIFNKATRIFQDKSLEGITVTSITGREVVIPIEHFQDSPLYAHAHASADKDMFGADLFGPAIFRTNFADMSEDGQKGILALRNEFRPSINYVTVDRMIYEIQRRPEGPIRKDDAVFCTINAVMWGWDVPKQFPGLVDAKKLGERLLTAKSVWERTQQGRLLNQQLAGIQKRGAARGMELRKLVALGLGTMAEDAATYQHWMAIELAARLGIKQVIMQDPAYTGADKEALAEHGVAVVNEDRAFDSISSDCVVVAIAPSFPALEIMQERVRWNAEWPAVIISERVEWTSWNYDRVTPRVEAMMTKYEHIELQQELDRNVFLETAVYARRPEVQFGKREE